MSVELESDDPIFAIFARAHGDMLVRLRNSDPIVIRPVSSGLLATFSRQLLA